ncbi:MAG: hypothetical protein GDA67_02790 [Nitrospira sp. CR1.3]|nr:hypothetical protein [Nitrospira sp. CR1.3]
MSYSLRVIPISEFLRTDVSGVVDLKASRELLKGLMDICMRENLDRILIDGREAQSQASTVDVWTLANDLGSLGMSREYRVAVLNRPKDEFDRMAFLELCATNRGYQLKAFREFEDAFTWLTAGESTSE